MTDGQHEADGTPDGKESAPRTDRPERDAAGSTLILARDVMPARLPVIPLSARPVFPKMTVPMIIDSKPLIDMLVDAARQQQKYVALVLQKDPPSGNGETGNPQPELHKMGVIAEMLQLGASESQGVLQVLFGAIDRCRIEKIEQVEPHMIARVGYVTETEMTDNPELKAYSVAVIRSIKELIEHNPLYKEELSMFMSHSNLQEPGRLADFAAALTTSRKEELQEVLETISIRGRLQKVLLLLKKETEIAQLQTRINKGIEQRISKNQREFFLREQLKAIKKELGIEKEGKETEVERFEQRLQSIKPSAEAATRISEELDKLRLIEPSSPEFNVTRNYLDWLTVLPWGVFSTDSFDLQGAADILNKDHYGLEDVKERILEFLSVGKLKGSLSGSILCFVGPPGVGKTSIGQSIARSIGRRFYRFSLGGMRDEAEIKGHRRTYIGAMPGKFLQAMKVCASANPVIMLDEIDKVGASYHGDPASSLLEVLDPEQNRDFLDHYLDVRFDLSNVFFICTANQLDTIPHALLDRMEIIKLAGYIQKEKLEIARRYLIPKQRLAHGLKARQLTLTARALREIIDGYAREPGVRTLENHIRKIMRKASKRIVEGSTERLRIDTAQDVAEMLGTRVFTGEIFHKERMPGVVMGLAWTAMGGETLFVEAAAVRTGKNGFKQTGQLGNVMVESAELAYAYVRGLLDSDETFRRFFAEHQIHLHVPAGATPKDGPSAGITMAAALYSLATGRPARPHVAMTGELSLTGLVMPIGGIKEKTIAAKRAGVKIILFPEANKPQFEELPAHIRKGLKPCFLRTFKAVVDVLF